MNLDIQKNGHPCIYMIKNLINNKVYIGSAIGHYKRKGQHYYLLRNNKHFNSHLQASWNTHGEENFEFKVLEFIKDLSLLKEREEFYINSFKANDNKKGCNFRIYCNTNLGTKRSFKSRLQQSRSKRGKTPNLNYTHIAKLNSKAIFGINKQTKEVLYFTSVKEAGEKTNTNRTCISKALHKKIKSAGGFCWDFVEKSTLKNSVNSGNIQMDNPEPSSQNGIKVSEKVQRLISEEPTNNLNTSAEHPEMDDDIVWTV